METNEKRLTDEEITRVLSDARKPGLRFTLDLYLLDYVKHCLFDDDQLPASITKLKAAVGHLDGDVRKGVEDVISCLECAHSEYKEYLEDMKTLGEGGYPSARGAGQTGDDLGTLQPGE